MKEFIKPVLREVNITSKKENIQTFELAPLSKGFGQTTGNSLRRVIIAHMPGLAGFAVEIKGAVHEFTAITGISEDVVQIILNLKELGLKYDPELIQEDEENQVLLKLVGKKGVVTAAQFETPNGIEIINKDLVIATTSSDKALEITLYVTIGRGFRSFEQNSELVSKKIGNKKGLIAIDSNFSPIKNVSYLVQPYKPGTDSEAEKLVLTIESNGALEPKEILNNAANFLIGHYRQILEINQGLESIDDELFVEEKFTSEQDIKLMKSIIDLNLSVRSYNALKRLGIEIIKELTEKTLDEVKSIKNLGKKSLEEVIEKIHFLGFRFKDEEDNEE